MAQVSSTKGKRRSNAVKSHPEPIRPVPQLTVQTGMEIQHNPLPPHATNEHLTFVDHLDYQLHTIADVVNSCRTERNNERLKLHAEYQSRMALEQVMKNIQKDLSAAQTRFSDLYNQHCGLLQRLEEFKSSHQLTVDQLNRELSEARGLVSKLQEHIKTCEMNANQVYCKLEQQNQVVKDQQNVIQELKDREQCRLPEYRDERALQRDLEFLLESPQSEMTSDPKMKRPELEVVEERQYPAKKPKTK